MMELPDYYSRDQEAKGYNSLMFRNQHGLQSSELNEMQDIANTRLAGVADALFKDGDLVSGGAMIVNPDTGVTIAESASIYLRGAVYKIPKADLTIPVENVTVAIGVYYIAEAITEIDDPELLDQIVGTRNYGEKGAARTKITVLWGFDSDGRYSDNPDVFFYPVYKADDGVLRAIEEPPSLDSVSTALARYDREANGHYITLGLSITYIGEDAGDYVIAVAEGTVNISGFKIRKTTSSRLHFPIDPDLRHVSNEPHTCVDDAGSYVVPLNRGPLATLTEVSATFSRTVAITHGGFTGASDLLPDAAIVSISLVEGGGTTYIAGDDYLLDGAEIDWSPTGQEPNPRHMRAHRLQ